MPFEAMNPLFLLKFFSAALLFAAVRAQDPSDVHRVQHHQIDGDAHQDSQLLRSSHRLEPLFFPNQTRAAVASGRSIRIYKQRPSLFRPSLFHVVKFPNDECYDASNQSGTCYTPLECKAFGGSGTSTCAKGYGVCCIISRSCHNVTAQKVVYFKNPSYPQADNTQNYCDLTLEIREPDVCQLRLDFMDFQLDQPKRGECLDDKLTVTASGVSTKTVPVLCGKNNNQHMYVHLDRTNTDRSASILFTTNSIGPYRWHIRVTQIDCTRTPAEKGLNQLQHQQQQGQQTVQQGGNPLRRTKRTIPSFLSSTASLKVSIPAPTGCLQYFVSPSGVIESFNFGQYLNNMDYAICIERLPSTCRVLYGATDFEWNIDKYGNGPKSAAGVGDQECIQDYLAIPGASATGYGPTRDRYCGGILSYLSGSSIESRIVSKANGPIVLRFHSDGHQDWDMKEGFRLRYEQSASNCEQPPFGQNLQNVLNSGTTGFLNRPGLLPYSPTAVSALQQDILSVNRVEAKRRTRFNAKRWRNFH